jgi:hypothetical protein
MKRQFVAIENQWRRRARTVWPDMKLGANSGGSRVQRHVELDCLDKPIGRAIILEADGPWFFGAHGAVGLEGLRGYEKRKWAFPARNVAALLGVPVPNVG